MIGHKLIRPKLGEFRTHPEGFRQQKTHVEEKRETSRQLSNPAKLDYSTLLHSTGQIVNSMLPWCTTRQLDSAQGLLAIVDLPSPVHCTLTTEHMGEVCTAVHLLWWFSDGNASLTLCQLTVFINRQSKISEIKILIITICSKIPIK